MKFVCHSTLTSSPSMYSVIRSLLVTSVSSFDFIKITYLLLFSDWPEGRITSLDFAAILGVPTPSLSLALNFLFASPLSKLAFFDQSTLILDCHLRIRSA